MAYPTSMYPHNRRSLQDLASVDVTTLRSLRVLGAAIVVTGAVLILLLVRLTGGTPNPLNHLGYFPVLLAAFIFGHRGGLAAVIYVGAVLGPLAPMLGLAGAHESLDVSLFRCAMLVVAAVTTGVLFDRVRTDLADLRTAAVDVADRQREGMVALARGAEAKDTDTGDHVVRVQAISSELALATGMGQETAANLGWSAMLHDIGKLHVPDRILLKPGPLDRAEWEVMRLHPVWGAEILSQGVGFEIARRIARSHHENFDGSGYPDGLAGEAIPIEARIVRLADAFDAMTHGRPYQAARPVAWALEEIHRFAGRQFDPELARLFLELIERDPETTARLQRAERPDGWEQGWTPVPGPFGHVQHEASR